MNKATNNVATYYIAMYSHPCMFMIFVTACMHADPIAVIDTVMTASKDHFANKYLIHRIDLIEILM